MFSYEEAVKIIYIITENFISQETSTDIDLYRVAIERVDHAFHVTLIDRLSKPCSVKSRTRFCRTELKLNY